MNQFDIAWPSFENALSSHFASFRHQTDFSDVTLLSDDEKPFSAHKFVLSACSPFFKNLLKRYSHQYPLLYLGGVDANSLENILDFMYKGSIKISQENLEDFLSSAQILKIEGLTDIQIPLKETLDDSFVKFTTNQPLTEKDNQKLKNTDFDVEKYMEEQCNSNEIGQSETDNKILTNEVIANNEIKTEFPMRNEMESAKKDTKPKKKIERQVEYVSKAYCYDKIKISHIDELKTKTDELAERVGNLWKCRMCGKTTPSSKRNEMNTHIEQHFDGVSYDCTQCPKSCKTRTALRGHMYRDHKTVPEPNHMPRII